MLYEITQIDFDFTDDDFEVPVERQEEIIDAVKCTVWEADNEEDLIEEISCATGWCIQSIDYVHHLADI
ncbi:hypothetical protein SWPG_00179 [Synechococcus phage S-CBM2]|nr:hypothetical protein SWPG_00179 [Synechococcus phage S-CBM2]